MDEQTARALGGKAAQAKLTPEERRRRGRKSARTLGREGRSARSVKGWEARKARLETKRPRCESTSKGGTRCIRAHHETGDHEDYAGTIWSTEPAAVSAATLFDRPKTKRGARPEAIIRAGTYEGVYAATKPATCAMGKECTHPDCEGQAIAVKVEPKAKMSKAERLAAGLCRNCEAPRYQDPKTGKTSALWCEAHYQKQKAFDKASWRARHGSPT